MGPVNEMSCIPHSSCQSNDIICSSTSINGRKCTESPEEQTELDLCQDILNYIGVCFIISQVNINSGGVNFKNLLASFTNSFKRHFVQQMNSPFFNISLYEKWKRKLNIDLKKY